MSVQQAPSAAYLELCVLSPTAQIHGAEAELQDDQGPSLCLPAPNGPQDIARDEAAEADFSSARTAGADAPCCQHGHHHGWPFQ